MNAAPSVSASVSVPAWRPIVAGGLICGTLDINGAFLSAWINGNMTPPVLLKVVASGVLGGAAFQGGAGVAAFGLLLHFGVAFSWTIIFSLLSRRFPPLLRHAWITGPIYGACVYALMNLLVLPVLAQIRRLYIPDTKPFVPHFGGMQFCIHLTCVGLAIALSVRHWSKPREAVPAKA